jgi:hypothetical protein
MFWARKTSGAAAQAWQDGLQNARKRLKMMAPHSRDECFLDLSDFFFLFLFSSLLSFNQTTWVCLI